MIRLLIKFLANHPVPSLAQWNSGWFSTVWVVNICLCAALSGIFSAGFPVPEIALSCRKSEFYNARAMFSFSMSDVTLFLSSCLCMWHLEWGNSKTAVLSERQSSSKACGTVRGQVLWQLQLWIFKSMFGAFWGWLFKEGGSLSSLSARGRRTVLKKAGCLVLCSASWPAKGLFTLSLQAAGLNSLGNPVTISHVSSSVPMILHICLSYSCLAHSYTISCILKGQHL